MFHSVVEKGTWGYMGGLVVSNSCYWNLEACLPQKFEPWGYFMSHKVSHTCDHSQTRVWPSAKVSSLWVQTLSVHLSHLEKCYQMSETILQYPRYQVRKVHCRPIYRDSDLPAHQDFPTPPWLLWPWWFYLMKTLWKHMDFIGVVGQISLPRYKHD